MKKVVIGLLILAVVAAGVAIFLKGKGNSIRFRTAPVTMGNIRATVTATGTVNAVTTVLVGTQVSGTIKGMHVDFNSKVKKGQVIAEIDPATFLAQTDQARANVLAAKANVDKAVATLADSKRTRDRNRELFSRNLIARSDLDTAESNYDANDAQVKAVQAQVAQTEAALRYAETNLAYTKILSPVNGVVVSRNVDVGQTVAASFQTPTLFTIAQDLTKMQIDTNIDEADIGKIALGQEVEFTVDAYSDSTFHGRVGQVRIAPTTVQNVVTYDVVIMVDNSDMRLKPGMTANVSVIVASKDDVLRVPNAALRFKPSEKDGVVIPTAGTLAKGAGSQSPEKASQNPTNPATKDGRPRQRQDRKQVASPDQKKYALWILEANKPKRVPVSVGLSDGTLTEITSGDLKEGQEVIVESLQKTAKSNGNAPPASVPRFR
jgi:HlyD family secretion protein